MHIADGFRNQQKKNSRVHHFVMNYLTKQQIAGFCHSVAISISHFYFHLSFRRRSSRTKKKSGPWQDRKSRRRYELKYFFSVNFLLRCTVKKCVKKVTFGSAPLPSTLRSLITKQAIFQSAFVRLGGPETLSTTHKIFFPRYWHERNHPSVNINNNNKKTHNKFDRPRLIETSEPRTNDCPFFSEIDNFVQRKTTFFFFLFRLFSSLTGVCTQPWKWSPVGGGAVANYPINGWGRIARDMSAIFLLRCGIIWSFWRDDCPWIGCVCVCVSWRLTGRTDVITSGDIIMHVIIAERGIISRFAAGWNWYSPGVGASKLKDIRIISCVIRIKGKTWTEIKIAIFGSVSTISLKKSSG